jgi:hypothetical protein
MSQFPQDEENNPGQSPDPDVPPEYLPSDLPAEAAQDAWQVQTPLEPPAVEPAAAVPPEYLSSGTEVFPPASEQHPLPSTDVPSEYLEEIPAARIDSLPPAPEPVGSAPTYRTNTAPVQPQPVYTRKDRSLAVLLEVLPGLFGFLGIGWLYAGNIVVGLVLLIGYLLFIGFEILIGTLTFGLACCFTLPLNVVAIAVSALLLNNYSEQHPEIFTK